MTDVDLQRDFRIALTTFMREWPEKVIDLLMEHEYISRYLSDDDFDTLSEQVRDARLIVKWGR